MGADGIGGIENSIDDVSLLNNMYYSDHYASDAQSEEVISFNASFEAEYGQAPYSAFNATGYDAAMILCKAIEAAGSTDYAAVVDAMKATDIQGVTGNITFDDHNDPIKSAFIMTYVDGVKTFCKQQNP